MATFKISSSGAAGSLPSVFTNSGAAFSSDTASADTLTVDADAFLSSREGHGAFLQDTGAWVVNVAGQIIGDGGGIPQSTFGIYVAGSGAKINISSEGSIYQRSFVFGGSPGAGIYANGASTTIVNQGEIQSSIYAVQLMGGGNNVITNSGSMFGAVTSDGSGNDILTNSGSITSFVDLGSGNNLVTNTGSINAFAGTYGVTGGTGDDTVTNKGSIIGGVSLGDGKNTFTNSKDVGGNTTSGHSYKGGTGNDTITNSGSMMGAVVLGGIGSTSNTNTLTNSGTIGSYVVGSNGSDIFKNSGLIYQSVSMLGGTNSFDNSGIVNIDVDGGSGVDTISNKGKFYGGLSTYGGNDVVTNSGLIAGLISLGDGDDTFTGGASADKANDAGTGTDTYLLGGGNDFFWASGATAGLDGLDTVDGGTGIDMYYVLTGSGFWINLDTVDHQIPFGWLDGSAPVIAKQSGKDLSTGSIDKVLNFEDVEGSYFGAAQDVIFGSAAANAINGNRGDDLLWGLGGNDVVNGGDGADLIVGGLGKDSLSGGADADVFRYTNILDSGVTKATRDTIEDFAFDGIYGEYIDLSDIDANTLLANDQAFHFIGSNVNWNVGDAGQLRAVWTATGQIIEGDVNGDRKADFSIFIYDGGLHVGISGDEAYDIVF